MREAQHEWERIYSKEKKKYEKMVDYSLSMGEGHGDDPDESPPEKARNPVVTGLISPEMY